VGNILVIDTSSIFADNVGAGLPTASSPGGVQDGDRSAWAALALDPARRAALGEAARRRGARLRWSTAVRHFSAVIDEAADGAR
jgi:hypothetical protein